MIWSLVGQFPRSVVKAAWPRLEDLSLRFAGEDIGGRDLVRLLDAVPPTLRCLRLVERQAILTIGGVIAAGCNGRAS